jgi:hypothetical protein
MPRTKKSRSEKRVPLAVYIPPGMLDQLRELAAKDRRTLSSETVLILEEALERKTKA